MSDETGSPAGGEAIVSVELPADAPETFRNANEAATYFSSLKASRPEKKEQPAESAEIATAEKSPSQEDDAAPEKEPGEDASEAEPAELPPIEPPRSWTKAEKAEWDSYPRSVQEAISRRAQDADRAIRTSQNEIAEIRKAAQAEREQMEKAKQEYEAKLPGVMRALHEASPFADIQSMADVEKLQAEDPFRFQQFQVYQWKMQAAQTELQQAEQRKTQEAQTQWAEHIQRENALAAEHIPELADKTKGPALTQRAAERLNELGFKAEELAALAAGREKLSIYDHRLQRLIFSDLKLSEIQNAPKAVAAKPVPQVQRPGTSKSVGSTVSEKIQALEAKFNRTGNLKDAQALYAAQLEAQTRRAS